MLPTMLWTPETHSEINAWVRESGRSRQKTAASNSRKGKAKTSRDQGRQSSQLRLRPTLEHPAELADLSREIWSRALDKNGQYVPLSVKEAQVISKTNCKSLINLNPAEPGARELLYTAWENLVAGTVQALSNLARTPRSQRQTLS